MDDISQSIVRNHEKTETSQMANQQNCLGKLWCVHIMESYWAIDIILIVRAC